MIRPDPDGRARDRRLMTMLTWAILFAVTTLAAVIVCLLQSVSE